MSISQELVDYDDVFRKLNSKPIIINDLADISEQERQRLNELISITYDSDLMRSVSSCQCGNVVGEHKVGEVCTECGHECRPPIEQDLEPIVWVRAPKGVRALMNTTVWHMLSERFTKGGHDIIRWICDSTYKSQRKPIKEIEQLEQMGFKRSYNWFVDNFDQIMSELFELPGLKKKQSDKDYAKNADLIELLKHYRHCIFSKYMPVPNRSLLVIEKNNVGTYVDSTVVGAIDAINIIASIDHELCYLNDISRQNRTVKMIAGLSEFNVDFYKETLGEKSGLARRHMFGTRAHFSIRAVATSITQPHQCDELHISWGSAIGAFKYHIINKLRKRGMTPNECLGFLNKHAKKYSPLLDQIFQELIAETKYGGIPATHGRNPTLARGSLQLLRITRVKTDVEDPTVSFSILITAPFNADKRSVRIY